MQHLGLLLLLGSTNITNDSWFLPDSVPCDFWYRYPVSVENPALIPRYKAEASRFFGSWRLRFHLELFFSDHLIEIIALIETKEISTKTEILGDSGYLMASANLNPNVGDFLRSFSLWNLEGNPLKDTPRNLRPGSFDDWRWLFLLCRDPSQS